MNKSKKTTIEKPNFLLNKKLTNLISNSGQDLGKTKKEISQAVKKIPKYKKIQLITRYKQNKEFTQQGVIVRKPTVKATSSLASSTTTIKPKKLQKRGLNK